MSDPLKTGEVSYDVDINPNPLKIVTSITVDKSDVKVVLDDIPDLGIKLKPNYSWNPINDVLTVIGTLSNTIVSKLTPALKDIVKGKSLTVYKVEPIHIDEGLNITLTPSNIALTNENGMLMISGDISVSDS